MKSLFWGFTFMYLLFAITIYEGETAQKNVNRNVKTTPRNVARNTNTQRKHTSQANRRISETKCQDYIRELNPPPKPQNGKDFTLHTLVIGGRNALEGEFPHMVRHDMALVSGALGWKTRNGSWSFKCGSSLISHKFSVTAAHCSRIKLDNTIIKREPEIIRLGNTNIKDGLKPIDANILRIIVHPQYKSPNKYYDIALVELKSSLKFTKTVQPVCLWHQFDTSSLGTKVSTAGWGVVNTVTKDESPILKIGEMNMIDSAMCSELLRQACNKNWCGIRENQMCAGKPSGGVDACQGDSGGPLQVKKYLTSANGGSMHYLIGVTSFGIGCGHAKRPGVYTRVSSFIDWIERIVWPH